MAIGANSYGTVAEVAALTGRYTNAGSYDGSSRPTNTPGAVWVDTIGTANFTVNCENDPGASNLDLGWRVAMLY